MRKKKDSEQSMEIKKIIVHDKYDPSSYLNDIALLQLEKPLELGPFVRTVCLPKMEENDLATSSRHGVATGWGLTKPLKPGDDLKRKDYSKVLKHASFKIQSDQLCRSSALPYLYNSTVMFCAGDGQGKNDSCKGDSGGAFVLEAERGIGEEKPWVWVAAGLVSWGNGCAQKDQYGYYTRVYPFIDWIEKKMQENSAKEDKE